MAAPRPAGERGRGTVMIASGAALPRVAEGSGELVISERAAAICSEPVESVVAIGFEQVEFPVAVGSEQAERAVAVACRRAHAEVVEFTVAPRAPTREEPRGGLDWLVEFAEPPRCALEVFTRTLDEALMSANAEYRARRAGDPAMLTPRLVELPAGTFYRLLRQQGRLGESVPRVTSDRALAGRLLASAALAGRDQKRREARDRDIDVMTRAPAPR